MPISVATAGEPISIDDCCTKRGYIPLSLTDGSLYWQICYFCANIVETIISPQAVLATSDVFTSWTQTGYKDDRPGFIRFDTADGHLSMSMPLQLDCIEGLYYCTSSTYADDADYDTTPRVNRVAQPKLPTHLRLPSQYRPTTKSKQLESELWLLRLGSPGVSQLDHLPGNATGIPSDFDYHPFRFIDFKEQARVRKQAVQRSALRVSERKRRFYMDYGFLRASTPDLQQPTTKGGDRVVFSHDGYTSYLLIVDEASRYIWVFLTSSKSPPLNIIKEFLTTHGLPDGGFIRTDQGGELARCQAFLDVCGESHYKSEPTGSDTPSQNGNVEIYNDKFGARVRSLLYGSCLPAKYWSDALIHCVYLHNRLIHSETRRTPFESYYGHKPDLSCLKVFGSRVCAKRAGKRRAKLDHNDFSGIFLGYTATDQNIKYIDINSGTIKTCHHATFDEAWYLQPSRPPAAQLLYDMGLEYDDDELDDGDSSESSSSDSVVLETVPPAKFNATPYPPYPTKNDHILCRAPPSCLISPLPLRETAVPRHRTAAAARVSMTPSPRLSSASDVVTEFSIGARDIATIYLSPDPYHEAFEEEIDIRRFDFTKHRTAGLCLAELDGRLFLGGIAKSTPCSRIPRWGTRIKGAWLIKVGPHTVSTIAEAQSAFSMLSHDGSTHAILLFSHPIVRQDISHDGLPIVSNAFAEAPPPKQPYFIRPDRAFQEWWVKHLQRDPIPTGHMIPVLSAMQGHPESPRLWEKHADKILREIGLTPTVHEPCLYSGIFNDNRILFMRQVDDFAIASPDAKTSDMLMDLIDDKLSIPIKRQGYLDMYNGAMSRPSSTKYSRSISQPG